MAPNHPPNELAELYDAFGRFHALLDSVIDKLDQDEATTVKKWQQAVSEYWRGSGPSGASSYGRQQRDRNEFSIHEYRDAFGDGDQVTDFRHHDVESVDERVRAALDDLDPVVPVAPESDTPLPILVQDDNDLAAAKALLLEFPAYPEADIEPPEDAESEDSVSLPEGRVERVEITVLDHEAEPDSRRDAGMQVRTAEGAEMSLDIWSTHDVSVDWTVGATYALEQPRHRSWDTDTGLRHDLSSTKDLRVTRVDDEASNGRQQTRDRPTWSSDTTQPSSNEESEEDDTDAILEDVISEFEELSDMESS